MILPSVLGVGSGLGWSRGPRTVDTFLGITVIPTFPSPDQGSISKSSQHMPVTGWRQSHPGTHLKGFRALPAGQEELWVRAKTREPSGCT